MTQSDRSQYAHPGSIGRNFRPPWTDNTLVEIVDDNDYRWYDQDWIENAPLMPQRGNSKAKIRSFEDHGLWRRISAFGWAQTPTVEVLGKGTGSTTVALSHPTSRQWIMPVYSTADLQTMRETGYGQPPTQLLEWNHVVESEGDVWLFKSYPTLGDTVDEARRRDAGGGYGDYLVWNEGVANTGMGNGDPYTNMDLDQPPTDTNPDTY